mmetsp:Transcript_107525/g.299007  ORF Transcript_107525/g.299007 Transcript_107525/m.299007 type:complete len:202 (+) Transcript_107525:252-857(+)
MDLGETRRRARAYARSLALGVVREHDHLVLEQQRLCEEEHVEHEHDPAQAHVQHPASRLDREHHKEHHEQQREHGHEEAAAVDGDDAARVHHGGLDEPRHRQAHADVKNVGADAAAHGHVAEAVARHDHGRERVWDGRAARQDGEAHDGVRDAQCVADDGCEPDHEVGEYCDPDERHEEGHQEPVLPSRVGAVRHRKVERQ